MRPNIMIRKLKLLILALLLPLMVQAQPVEVSEQPVDTPIVTFITCSPGDEIHRLYGHTALRLTLKDEDWAVNYGWFSFNTPNFIMKFILGLTDYSMAYQTMPIFVADLMRDNMSVVEQDLNLTPEEAITVNRMLQGVLNEQGYDRHEIGFGTEADGSVHKEVVLGARWTYRYNFLYDNCTTRAVDIIKAALKEHGETIVYPNFSDAATTTQRMMIHEFTRNSPWYEFGQDLLLGPEVDEEHSNKELSEGGLNFLPTYAQNFFEAAHIRSKDGKLRPLVTGETNLTPYLIPQEHHPAVPVTPLMAFGIVYAMSAILTINQRKANRHAAKIGTKTAAQRAWNIWGNAFDFTCWTLQGIVGILLCIMVGWSEHPAVGTNWLLLIFNPLFFLGIPARLKGGKYETAFAWYATIMAIAILLVHIFGLQQIPSALFPIALIVATRVKVK